MILSAGPASATDVTTDIISTSTWDATGSPYIIKSDIHVADGVTLTIAPRVRVLFDGKYSLFCDGAGKIIAMSSAYSQIDFSSNKPNPYTNEWVSVYTGVGGVFSNCSFFYGTYALVAQDDAVVTDCSFSKGYMGLDISGRRVVASGCVFGSLGIGIRLAGSEIRVAECLVRTSSSAGVTFEGAYRSVVEDCRIDACEMGVKFIGSTMESAMERCVITYSDTIGIYYRCFGTGNRIANGTISDTLVGIQVLSPSATQSTDVTIRKMRVFDCEEKGIEIPSATTTDSITVNGCYLRSNAIGAVVSSRKSVTIAECTFWENQMGLLWGTSPEFGGLACWNNFVNNTEQADTSPYGPLFDHNGKGNYWSDYTGPDRNGDGIGDIPYQINGWHEDEYPLMRIIDPIAPIAMAGPNRTILQHELLTLSGSESTDDLEIANFTWVIDLTGPDVYVYTSEASLRIDEAGVFNVTLEVRDFRGNMDADSFVLTVLDSDAPSIALVDFIPYATTGDPFEIRCDITDNMGVTSAWLMYEFGTPGQVRLDLVRSPSDGLWNVTLDVPPSLQAPIRATVHARDEIGNTATTQELSVEVQDDDRPVVTNMSISQVTTGDLITLGCIVTDNWAVATVTAECSFGILDVVRSNLTLHLDRWYCSLQVPTSARSTIVVSLTATDTSGNILTVKYDPIKVIDNDPPVVQADLPGETVTGGFVFLSCNVTDNWFVASVHIEYWYDDGERHLASMTQRETQTQWIYTLEVPLDARTPLWLRFNASDNSGNIRLTEVVEIPVHDDAPPTLLRDLAPSTLNKGADELFAVHLVDNIGVVEAYLEIQFAGGDWQSLTLKAEGVYRQVHVLLPTDGSTLKYRYRARDAAGNELLTEPVARSVLSQDPSIKTTPKTDAYTYRQYTVEFTALDEDTPLEDLFWTLKTNATWLSMDGKSGVLSGMPTGQNLGVYRVNVSVVDGAGGCSVLVFDLTVHYLNSAPTVSVLDPTSGVKVSGKLSASGTATDVDGTVLRVRARIDGGEWANVSGTESWSIEFDLKGLKPGDHTLEVVAHDGTDESEPLRVDFSIKDSDTGSGMPAFGAMGALGALSAVMAARGAMGGRARRPRPS